MQDREITGSLRDVTIVKFGNRRAAVGTLVGEDAKMRFNDGERIRTSYIVSTQDDLIITRNSVYRIIAN